MNHPGSRVDTDFGALSDHEGERMERRGLQRSGTRFLALAIALSSWTFSRVLVAAPHSGSVRASEGEEDEPRDASSSEWDGLADGVTDEALRASRIADACLKFLAESSRLQGDGSFQRNTSGKDATVAKTALGALAFMANGHTLDQGAYVQEVRSCIRWILTRTKPTNCDCGMLEGPHQWASIFDANDTTSRMHGHGYATWALALAYGMTFGERNEHDRQELRAKLQAAVHCIELAQTESGGWGYEYQRGMFHEGSVTITQLQALRAAHEAGIRVDESVIQGAIRYIRNSQVKNGPAAGGFRYKLGSPDTSFALTAAAVSALNQTGVYDGEFIERGIEYMRRTDPLANYKEDDPFPWYGRLYATQSYWQYQSLRHFRRYYPRLVDALERQRNPENGSFSGSEHGDIYCTSMAALTLAVPFGYLPSFQR